MAQAAQTAAAAALADFRARIRGEGPPLFGTCCTAPAPLFVPATVKAGVDMVFLDTEHVPLPRDVLTWMCQGYRAAGVAPLTRVPAPDPFAVCQHLDGGSLGVVAPYIETIEQAKSLIGAAKLRPLKGQRLQMVLDEIEPLCGKPELLAQDDHDVLYEIVARVAGAETARFCRQKNEGVVLLLNIESRPALEVLEQLASLPGVDGLLVGPHDLSVNLDCSEDWDHPDFLGGIDTIIQTARKFGKGAGAHYSFKDATQRQAQWVRQGATLVVHKTDVRLYSEGLVAALADIRTRAGFGGQPAAADVEDV